MDCLHKMNERRSIRRFIQKPIPADAFRGILDAARLAPTSMNMQELRFVAIANEALCKQIFSQTKWAALLPDGSGGPTEATQPTAYVAILIDQQIKKQADVDAGAAGMAILLAAQVQGIASCWLGNINRDAIMKLLDVPTDRFVLHSMVALGYAAMQSKAVPLPPDGSTAYFMESPDCLCVPKRTTDEVVRMIE